MKRTSRRTEDGGWSVDRSRPLAFRFDGTALTGCHGDTIASALLANGIRSVGGVPIAAAGPRAGAPPRAAADARANADARADAHEQTGADARADGFAQAGVYARAEAYVVCGAAILPVATTALEEGMALTPPPGPSPRLASSITADAGRTPDAAGRSPAMVLPSSPANSVRRAWPARVLGWFRRRTSPPPARSPSDVRKPTSDHITAHVDILIVGGGAAGLAAALTAARGGARVLLAEAMPSVGGRLLTLADTATIDGRPPDAFLARTVSALDQLGALILTDTVAGADDAGVFLYQRSGGGHLWRVRAGAYVWAAGHAADEADREPEGVMSAAAALTFVRRFGVAPGARAVVAAEAEADGAAMVAEILRDAGVEVAAIVGEGGDEAHRGHRIAACDGGARLTHVRIAPGAGGRGERIACDLLVRVGALRPVAPPDTGCRATWRPAVGAGLAEALQAGSDAGVAAARAVGIEAEPVSLPVADGATLPVARAGSVSPAPIALPDAVRDGPYIGAMAEPVRFVPADPWHRERAVYEALGEWRVPSAYPGAGENVERAAYREALAAREIGGIADMSAAERFEIVGPRALATIDGIVFGGAPRLGLDQAATALALGADGRALGFLRVDRVAHDRFEILADPRLAAVRARFAQSPVTVTDLSDTYASAVVCGPERGRILAAVFVEALPALPKGTRVLVRLDGVELWLLKSSQFGHGSVEIISPARYGLALWERLVAAGAAIGAAPIGRAAMRLLWMEEGRVDVTPALRLDPAALGPAFADPARPHASQSVIGLVPMRPVVLEPGARLLTRTKTPLGAVLAGAVSPFLKRPIAQALVDASPPPAFGSKLFAEGPDGRTVAVRVVPARVLEERP
ncbi:FAD-dependent oxidoreductase [Acuticoccus sp. M5D2P5]|uniref:FAD-dependent oxidoreductase n=1 Tax=Acuticoccus kalidii TaxID=2910977 RepID=UPI001F2E1639|nr:FAD-dependent oxidoreductase [Acuticoccus kalidii]MCF3934282.1 FAD-dependent oxidoreductase [Acuticoccus kalidii]